MPNVDPLERVRSHGRAVDAEVWYCADAPPGMPTGVPYEIDAETGYIEPVLETLLTSDPDVSAIIETKVYPIYAPEVLGAARESRLPMITYQAIGSFQLESLTGLSGLITPNYQLNCWASTYKQAAELGEAAVEALSGVSGIFGNVQIQDIRILNTIDLPNTSPKGQIRSSARSIIIEVWATCVA